MKWKSRVWILKIGMRDFGRAFLLPRSGVVVVLLPLEVFLDGWQPCCVRVAECWCSEANFPCLYYIYYMCVGVNRVFE